VSDYILVIDEGTTSTRAMLFDAQGQVHGSHQEELTQYYPAPGLVEHDAVEIWDRTLNCAREMVTRAGGPEHIIAIGITNQRETVVFWDKRTGEPVAPAIVWQDRRTADICDTLKAAGHEPLVQSKTGLLLDPYFSGSKIGWAMQHWPDLRALGTNLAFGTVESYLVFRLTGGLHISDATNASRTALMDIHNGRWADDLCEMFGAPITALPFIVASMGAFGTTNPELFGGEIPITGLAGDQQSATIGQGCLRYGQTKATYGTGAFVLTATGREARNSNNRLLTTILYDDGIDTHYALEGSVFVAGSLIQWLRDELGMITRAADSEALARSVDDNGGVFIVPAFSGLGAPHWLPHARASFSGMNFATTRAHIIRAALESMAHQTHDLKSAFAADGADWAELRIDGGMVTNDWLAQDLADILDLPTDRPAQVETTALGAAMLAAVGAGIYADLPSAAAAMGAEVTRFTPEMDAHARDARLAGWSTALATVLR
jgi:glycerol kinase